MWSFGSVAAAKAAAAVGFAAANAAAAAAPAQKWQLFLGEWVLSWVDLGDVERC